MRIDKTLIVGGAILIAVIATIGSGSGLGVAVANSASEFCSSPGPREYYPPLKGMRTVPEPPDSGRLPFAPPGLEIRTAGGLLAEAGHIGFDVAGYLKQPRRLNWDFVTLLMRVDRKGRPGRVLRERHESVGVAQDLNANPLDLSFKVGKSPAVYRVDSYFRSWAGRKLAHYAQYFRVIKRTVDVQLGIYKNSLHPGDTVVVRLENLGTAPIFFGVDFVLEIWDETAWVRSPLSPAGFILPGFGIGGGGAAECNRFQLPVDAPPGHYRMSKPYSVSMSRHERFVRAEFDVSA